MSLLTKASLVMTPNAIKESKVYSIIPSNGNGDLDFTRGTTATLTNDAGLIETVSYNLLTFSEQFDQSVWIKTNSTISPNSINSPNLTLTADKLIDSATNTQHYLTRAVTNVPLNSSITISIFAKKAELNFLRFAEDYSIGLDCIFDLNNGTATNETFSSVSIIDAGNGWYRCSATINVFSATIFGFRILLSKTGAKTYLGNGIDGIYIWGAQLVQGSLPKDYFFTTDRLNVPRLNYDSVGGCPSLLLEPQRMNRLLNSAVVVTQTIATTGVACTVSFYGTGTIAFSGTYVGTLVGTGVNNRVSLTFTPTTGSLVLTVTGSVTKGQLETGSYPTSYIPTTTSAVTRNADSFVKTGIADLINSVEGVFFVEIRALFNDTVNRRISLSDTTLNNRIVISYTATANTIRILNQVAGNLTYDFSYVISNSLNFTKIAFKYQQNNFKVFVNGVLVNTSLIGITNSANVLNTLSSNDPISNSFLGNIKQLQLFPTPLTDTEMINLTTL